MVLLLPAVRLILLIRTYVFAELIRPETDYGTKISGTIQLPKQDKLPGQCVQLLTAVS